MKLLIALSVFLGALILYAVLNFTGSWVNPTNKVVTHQQAVLICEKQGLVYNYESEGTSYLDFCDEPELTMEMK